MEDDAVTENHRPLLPGCPGNCGCVLDPIATFEPDRTARARCYRTPAGAHPPLPAVNDRSRLRTAGSTDWVTSA